MIPQGSAAHVRVAIVGTGFAGLGMAVRLRQAGIEDFVVLERAERRRRHLARQHVPRLPVRRPSHLYSLSFAPNPDWSRTFSPRPEIQAYLRGFADDYGLRAHLRLGCTVTEADGTRTQPALARGDLAGPADRATS